MIVSSIRARIAKDTPGALAWANEVAEFVKKKTGNEIEVLMRIGATQDIVWLQRFPDLRGGNLAQPLTAPPQKRGCPSSVARWMPARALSSNDTPRLRSGRCRTDCQRGSSRHIMFRGGELSRLP
jgi:hypothetical protein